MPAWIVKALAIGPGVVVSVVMVGLALAAIPPKAAAPTALALVVLLAAAWHRTCEGGTAAMAVSARRLRPSEREDLAAVLTELCRAGLGPPLVDLRVQRSPVIGALGVGRRTVVISTGLIEAVALDELPTRRAAAVIAHAAVLVSAGLTRSDLVIRSVSTPWRAMRATVRALCRWGVRVPFARAAWKLRAIIVAVAVVQTITGGHLGLALSVAFIGALNYALPVWEHRWWELLVRAGDEGVAHAGLGDHLAAFLRTCPDSDAVRTRLRALAPSGTQRPPLGLVTL